MEVLSDGSDTVTFLITPMMLTSLVLKG